MCNKTAWKADACSWDQVVNAGTECRYGAGIGFTHQHLVQQSCKAGTQLHAVIACQVLVGDLQLDGLIYSAAVWAPPFYQGAFVVRPKLAFYLPARSQQGNQNAIQLNPSQQCFVGGSHSRLAQCAQLVALSAMHTGQSNCKAKASHCKDPRAERCVQTSSAHQGRKQERLCLAATWWELLSWKQPKQQLGALTNVCGGPSTSWRQPACQQSPA